MALFKSQVITQASGSVGGLTYSHNASGMYIRARAIPTNPSTARQRQVRNAQTTISQAWGNTLTDLQRQAWTVYAANVPVKNRQGDVIKLSGIAMFMRCNLVRLQTNNPIAADAPTTFNLGDPTTGGTITQAGTTPFALSLAWTNPATVDDTVYVFTARPQSATINFFKGPFVYSDAGSTDSTPLSFLHPYGYTAGQKVFVRTRIIYADGRVSPAAIYQFVATHDVPPAV